MRSAFTRSFVKAVELGGAKSGRPSVGQRWATCRYQDADAVRVVDKNLRSSRGRKATIPLTTGGLRGGIGGRYGAAVVDSGTGVRSLRVAVRVGRKLFGVSQLPTPPPGPCGRRMVRRAAQLRKIREPSIKAR
jgi:hypothetical protein